MAEEIKIIVGADASQLEAELIAATNELKKLESQLKKATDVDTIKKLNTEIRYVKETIVSLEAEGAKLSNTLGNKLKNNSDKATQSITDLSRIVQDAPYGFIGIANNINPLVESFSRLKQESGSVGGALKSLLSGLTGPAGLGIAFAAVTTAITFAQVGFNAWTRSSGQAKKNTKDLAEELKKAEINAISNGLRLEGLTKIITDSTKSEKDRNAALIEANSLLKPYGDKIDSINISVAKAKELTDSYTEALINQAIGAKLADKIADLRIKKKEKENEILKFQIDNNRILKISQKDIDAAGQGAIGIITAKSDANNKLNNLLKDQTDIQKQLDNYTSQYSVTVEKSLKTDKEKAKTTKKTGETLTEALAAFEKSLKAVQATGLSLGTPQFEINQDKIKEFESILKKIIEKFNVDPKNKVYLDLETRLKDLQFEQFKISTKEALRKAIKDTTNEPIPIDNVNIVIQKTKFNQTQLDNAFREGLINQIQTLSKKYGKKIPIGTLNLSTEGLKKTFNKLKEDFKTYSTDIENAATGFLRDISSNIAIKFGEALGAAISGGNFGNVFKGVFDLISSGIQSLGEQLIKVGFLAVIAQQSLSKLLANPYAAIAAGIALVALGAAIKNLTNQQKFAVGTNYAPGGMALVGERGPELVNLPRGSQVIPAGRTASMMGGISSQIEVFGVLKGQDIYFSNKKYGQTYGRTT